MFSLHDTELIQVMRGGHIDCVHRGRAVVVDRQGKLVFKTGDSHQPTFMRSVAKPFQTVAILESGAAEMFHFDERELAIASGSHSGTPMHVDIVRGMLEKIGADVADLHNGAVPPLDRAVHEQLIARGESVTPLHQNCSGKHTGMLAVCKAKGWDWKGYYHADHPLQAYLQNIVERETHTMHADVETATDGCSVVTFGIPLYNIALGFMRLGTAPESTPLHRIAHAMQTHPTVFSGENRGDADLVRITNGRIIAKFGAETVFGMSIVDKGMGIAIKISDGSDRPLMAFVIALLNHLDMISPDEAAQLEKLYPRALTIHDGQQVGEMNIVL